MIVNQVPSLLSVDDIENGIFGGIMLLRKLVLENIKGIKKIEIDFTKKKNSHSIIFVGENGGGKSTIFEALLVIFGSFFSPRLNDEYDFSYLLHYSNNGDDIILEKKCLQKQSSYKITSLDLAFFVTKDFNLYRKEIIERDLLPKKIITSYSGSNDRLSRIYQRITANYKTAITQTLKSKNKYNEFDIEEPQGEYLSKRFIHTSIEDVFIYLPAIWTDRGSIERKIIEKYCKIKEIGSITIEIKLTMENLDKIFPDAQKKLLDNWIPDNQKLSNSVGYFEKFLFKMNRGSFKVKPILSEKRSESNRVQIIVPPYLFNEEPLEIFDFLEKFRSLFNADILTNVKKNESEISLLELSEGELQLIKVIGMLYITKKSDGIVMLDEPDAHMNPKWKYELKGMIDKIIKNAKETQVLINTHDPLLINGSKSEEVRIIRKNNDVIMVYEPSSDAIGKSIDGILGSQYFDLETTLDSQTKMKVDKKNKLYIKKREQGLNKKEEIELNRLYKEIDKMEFTFNYHEDKFYKEYISIVNEINLESTSNKLSDREVKERKDRLKNIIQQVLSQ